TPRKEIDLKSQVSGVVEKLHVEAGEIVNMNDIIAKIKIIPNVVMLNSAEMRLKTALINFKNAHIEMKRQQDLFKEDVISEQDYNQYLLEYELRKQEVEAAENNLELVKEGASKNTGTVSNVVRSTAEGMVIDVPVKEGSFVIESNTFNEGTTIATVANMKDMIFEGKVDESEVGKIKEGMKLDLLVGALQDEKISAELEYISPKGIEEDGAIQFEIKAAVNLNNELFLRAGYSANADIVLQVRDSVLAIKENDLLFENDKVYVEIETGEQLFRKQKIETGLSDGINIEILSGITADQKIKKQ
ncbi:MAG: efflux RND transporter periplasmic adaptor subunit, partial [Cyclobacteriaceae bacterium]|nr:efflux RND transporter periplasmic adaptor subunit [Cyclobacteriaceae bacterium]